MFMSWSEWLIAPGLVSEPLLMIRPGAGAAPETFSTSKYCIELSTGHDWAGSVGKFHVFEKYKWTRNILGRNFLSLGLTGFKCQYNPKWSQNKPVVTQTSFSKMTPWWPKENDPSKIPWWPHYDSMLITRWTQGWPQNDLRTLDPVCQHLLLNSHLQPIYHFLSAPIN